MDTHEHENDDQLSETWDETNASDEYLGGISGESSREISQIEGNSPLLGNGHDGEENMFSNFHLFCLFFVVFIAVGIPISWYMTMRDTINYPLNVPKVKLDWATAAEIYPNKFWGTYRANLYFGLKTRSPRSPVVGFIWFEQRPDNEYPSTSRLRHWCSEDDNLVKYGWLRHDGINFGIHEVVEKTFTFNTTFVKFQGGLHGREWSARVTAHLTNPNVAPIVSFFVYTALDNQGHLYYSREGGRVFMVGKSEELGDFDRLSLPRFTDSPVIVHDFLEGHVSALDVLDQTVEKNFVYKYLYGNKKYFALKGTNKTDLETNFVVHQITAQLPLEFEVIFSSHSFHKENLFQGKMLTEEIGKLSQEFDEKFSSVFNLKSKRYTEKAIHFAKETLSNMLGSISYFYGSSKVQSEKSQNTVKYWETSLYTSIPSRSKFPRGFLWNVGFDLHLITLWDTSISEDIIAHWLDLINVDGWIPREQILGAEAEAMVPSQFIVQRNNIANPPSLFLAIQNPIEHSQRNEIFLNRIFLRLEKWFNWLLESQAGKEPTSFYWRGRNTSKEIELIPYTFASGLDDYPRTSHPDGNERHLDLRCWMALASGVLKTIAKRVGKDSSTFERIHKDLTDNKLLDTLHWDPDQGLFSDYGLHTDWLDINSASTMLRSVYSDPTLRYIGTFGYISLFPLMLKILNSDSPRLLQILSDLKNEDLLWTKYGIRSLSKTSKFYNKSNSVTDPPHWRGAIWINMNYLIIGGLYHYSHVPGPYKKQAGDIYTDLRKNVVQNIFKEFFNKGYIFERYDDISGAGKGSFPFTGWSALVVNIMAEKY